MYMVPEQVNDIYYTQCFNVLKFSRTAGWTVAYKETERGNPGSDDLMTEVVSSPSRKQAIVVILKHSGAGTSTFWHLVASINGKITRIEPKQEREKALADREYADKGYNAIKVDEDRIVETIAGYSPHAARCCPNRPSLAMRFKFSGSSIALGSVKELPYGRPQTATGPMVHLNENGLWAYGYKVPDGFLVLGGSESHKRLRLRLPRTSSN